MKEKTIGKVIQQNEIAANIYEMQIETSIAKYAKPGQFVSVFTKDNSKILPRPISICKIETNTITLVYRIAGEGTKEFATYIEGDEISLMGPLGNGFSCDEISEGKTVILMGGGIGVPPMLGCAKALAARNVNVNSVMGYRNNETFLSDEFEKVSNLTIATEDGSVGTRGNVIDAIKANAVKGDYIFACGPKPMLRAIASYASSENITCYISMEERMACGIGACLACTCKTTDIDDHSKVNNKRICKDGPVFLAGDIDLD